MKYLVLVIFLNALGCASLQKPKAKPPLITRKTPLKTLLVGAVEWGGPTLLAAKKQIKKRNAEKHAEKALYKLLMKKHIKGTTSTFVNAMELFTLTRSKRAYKVFLTYSKQSSLVHRQMAWKLAGDVPSKSMAEAVEDRLTSAILEDDLSSVLMPNMANAVMENRLASSYTIVREGLLTLGASEFAHAMLVLNPNQASIDFLDYLALAPIDEIRQLNINSVDMYSCTVILQHFLSYPPPVTHPKFESVILFTLSRNHGLSEMARDVLISMMPKHGETIALSMARLPTWMQLAFVEKSHRKLTPVLSVFLKDLKRVSAQKEVIDEIDTLYR